MVQVKKRRRENLLKRQGYTNRRLLMALVALIIAFLIFGTWYFFFYAKDCDDSACFIEAMKVCSRVSWLKEDSQANWRYNIIGTAPNQSCKVEIELVTLKEGTIDAEGLQGKKMICNVRKGETDYPEKDTSRCTGPLKEELQEIIIQRLHNVILENLGNISEEFKEGGIIG
jgi:hypothetical protein